MRLSFAIPAYNEEAYLAACLESILAQTRDLGDAVEIVVVNNASTDRTRGVALGYPGVRRDCVPGLRHQPVGAARRVDGAGRELRVAAGRAGEDRRVQYGDLVLRRRYRHCAANEPGGQGEVHVPAEDVLVGAAAEERRHNDHGLAIHGELLLDDVRQEAVHGGVHRHPRTGGCEAGSGGTQELETKCPHDRASWRPRVWPAGPQVDARLCCIYTSV